MKLVDYKKFADTTFSKDSRPHDITLQRWLREGKLPGRKIGGNWYVDVHAFAAANDPLVERVLAGES
ncbi:hypothetical protein CO615_04185 [Lysobacteraceae bacterium NML75-0749]|nr:hypothetical protein CO615_04185 [Xanthomonadaceae bacterium NML75-0749]